MLSKIISEYKKLIPCDWEPEDSQLALSQKLIEFSNANHYSISTNFTASYMESKTRFEQEGLSKYFRRCFF